jgi:hypothetical protein
MSDLYEPQPLRCRTVHWNDDKPKVKIALNLAPEHMTHDVLVEVARELDRRFMQLHDKVVFERDHNLVNYGLLNPKTHYSWGEPYQTIYGDNHNVLGGQHGK